MKNAKIVLSAVAMLAIVGGAFAFKASRTPKTFYILDSTNPNPALQLCTKTTVLPYTTFIGDAIPGAIPLQGLPYYTTPTNTTTCPTTLTWYSAQ